MKKRNTPPKNSKYEVKGVDENGEPEMEERFSDNHPEGCDCEWWLSEKEGYDKEGKYWMHILGDSCMSEKDSEFIESLNKGVEN